MVNRGYWGWRSGRAALPLSDHRPLRPGLSGRLGGGAAACLGRASGPGGNRTPLPPPGPATAAPWSASGATPRARLALLAQDTGRGGVDYVSLIPEDAVCGVFRPDLLEVLRPCGRIFCAFPGAAWWRRDAPTALRLEAHHRPGGGSPGALDALGLPLPEGLGLHEYLLLCEQLGASAMYVFNCGMTCQARKASPPTPTRGIDWSAQRYRRGGVRHRPRLHALRGVRSAAGHPAPST